MKSIIRELTLRATLLAARLLPGRPPSDAADLAQEAWLKVLDNAPPDRSWYERRAAQLADGWERAFAAATRRRERLAAILARRAWSEADRDVLAEALAERVIGEAANLKKKVAPGPLPERWEPSSPERTTDAVYLQQVVVRLAESLRAIAGAVARRAEGVLACYAAGVVEPDEMASRLAIPASQVYPARALLRELLQRFQDAEAAAGGAPRGVT